MAKRFHRSKRERILGGVFGGLSEVIGIEANILRWLPFVATVIVYVLWGGEAMLFFLLAVVLAYTGYWFAMPAK